MDKAYIAIDLKSFYASVECVERGLDPLTTNLVVADKSRTEKTICLAVSPALKAHGVPGRPRLFEVVQKVQQINAQRKYDAPGHTLSGASCSAPELQQHPEMALDYIVAPPQMAKYMEYSTRIYSIYLKYIAPEDIHVYSIDEVFIDATPYLNTYHKTAREFTMTMILDVLKQTGITATAGIGTNLYLCKVAMDIGAKHIQPDENGVRIAALDEMTYRQTLWTHQPLTDFWRIGKGYAKKLEAHGIHTMGDVARCSVQDEEFLYRLFGKNAELLIDHAWGWELCTIKDIKAYKPNSNSIGSGQVLQEPYPFDKAKLVAKEMVDLLVLDLVDRGLISDQIVMTVDYDTENLKDEARRKQYHREVTTDRYGRQVPKHAHGTANLKKKTASTKMIMEAAMELFERIVDPNLLIRRINVTITHVVSETEDSETFEQLDLFAKSDEKKILESERKIQEAMLGIKKKYGKNAILKGFNFEEGATTKDRNQQIGGHKA